MRGQAQGCGSTRLRIAGDPACVMTPPTHAGVPPSCGFRHPIPPHTHNCTASPKSPEAPDITPMASQTQMPAVCLHQWRVPQFALKPLQCPHPQGGDRHLATPPPRGRPLRAVGGDFKGGGLFL